MPGFTDNFFKKVEKKTNVNKESILQVARKLQGANMKDEVVLRDVIKDIAKLANKNVDKEKEDKIVEAVLKDKVPQDIDKLV